MWKKLIFGLVLAAVASLQLVNALTCYSCNSPTSCRSPTTQVCNDDNANTTSLWLNTIHSDVPSVAGSLNYRCMNLTYFFNGNQSKTQEYLGCYHPAVSVCALTLNATNSNTWAKGCTTCNWDKCNHNPAGTFSKSTFTILASGLALFLAKLAV